jgi:NAD(P)-dependent dehydrogenase (short-subunit alcohol dehydrogenase family)
MSFTPVEEVTEELWDRIMDINVKGILGSKFAILL